MNVIKYSFTVASNCATYVAHVVTLSTFGDHVSLNVYVYCCVLVFVGVAQLYAGVVQYATIHDWITFQSPSLNVIKYSFTVASNWAMYVAHVVTDWISGLHVSLNVYVY